VVAVARASVDIDALWEYGDPARSETRFRAALANTNGDERLELLTQIARTYSLRKRFDDAHRSLDEVATALSGAGAAPRVRYLLERGRTLNSAGASTPARSLFIDAWERANAASLDGLAVDAAHMVAITHRGTEAAIEWNRKGLALARSSTNAKAQALVPAMLNNSAWDLHEMGRHAEALPLFEQALAAWTAAGKPPQIRVARWSVARCLRSLGRLDEALATQLALEKEDQTTGTTDGFVLEEVAEIYDAQGRQADARSYFAQAATVLGRDASFVKNEPERLARLRSKSR
jgi:tetratricopeptide (TPR) repeat protein